MAIEIVKAAPTSRDGNCKIPVGAAATDYVRGMITTITEASGVAEVNLATASDTGPWYWITQYDSDNTLSDTELDALAASDRVVTLGEGTQVATDQYTESDATSYNVGDVVEVSGTSGKIMLRGVTALIAVGIVVGTRPANATASKEMVVIQLLAAGNAK